MNLIPFPIAALACCAVFATAGVTRAEDSADPAGIEVLTRGPVHEAFAETVAYNPQPGLVVGKKPPEPIEEIPPEQRLAGENVEWISGYWAWDEDRDDFLWVSGIWRNVPPGRVWTPGFWSQVDGGWQWTAGYWKDAAADGITYLPEPPRSVEEGPNVPAPTDDAVWIPGNWSWRDSRYAWSAGFWNGGNADWIWTPSRYSWTSRGCVFVNGYWDYGLARRGVLFAPVRFDAGIYGNPGFSYCPSTVIGAPALLDHLFLRPAYCHYYFGDYYAPAWRNRGWYASYFYNSTRRGCDPIYSHFVWENRHAPNWERSRRDLFAYRQDHASARPARVWSDGGNQVGERYARVVGRQSDRFRTMDAGERTRVISQPRIVRKPAAEARVVGRNPVIGRTAVDGPVVSNRIVGRSGGTISPPVRAYERQAENRGAIAAPVRRTVTQPRQIVTRQAAPAPTRQIQRTAPQRQIQRPAPQRQIQRTAPQRQIQRPAPQQQIQRTSPQRQMQRQTPSAPQRSSGRTATGQRQH